MSKVKGFICASCFVATMIPIGGIVLLLMKKLVV
jgi:hypothetical protein